MRKRYTTYAWSREAPPLPRFGKTFSFLTLYSRGLGVLFSGFYALFSISTAMVIRGALSMLGFDLSFVTYSFQGLSWTRVYAPAPGNYLLYLASASMLPGVLFLGITPLIVTFLGLP